MQARPRQPAEGREQRRRVAPTGRSTRSRAARVALGDRRRPSPSRNRVADGEPLRPISLGRRPRQQQQPLAQRTPRPVPVGRRRPVVGPGHRVEPGDGIEDALERRERDDRILPGRSQAMSSRDRSGMRIATPSPSDADAEVRRDERLGQAHPAAGDQPFAKRDVVRRPDDPVDRRGRPLDDEPLVAALGWRSASRPTSRRSGTSSSGIPASPFALEELTQRIRGSRPQQGAGTSSAPSGPPSR